nr:relaxase/mobilization nuclease domain-containing protein [Pedobacter sp. ASV19]
MVAVIKSGYSIRRTFHYNENKVKEGVADCILAQNYPLDHSDMTENMRLNMLLKVAERNPRVSRNSVHISLNFAREEQPAREQLKDIAADYMEQIGFGNQPYLVYQHYDAGHPHIHIATTKVRPDGSTIDIYNIGKNQSETARKAIEIKYGLVKAEDHKGKVFRLKPIDASKISYGQTGTKRAITVVLDAVLQRYAYTSLPELNAVLNLYNVSAERGSEGSRTYKTGGLVYRVLDADGKPVSTPIKASAFYNRPTLKYLEENFAANDPRRQQHKTRLKNRIDWAFVGRKPDLDSFAAALKKEGVDTVFRFSAEGFLYGITYVDHKTQSVFNGSALGSAYSAKAITERCAVAPMLHRQPGRDLAASLPSTRSIAAEQNSEATAQRPAPVSSNGDQPNLLEQLMQAENSGDALPYALSAKSNKKKKRKSRTL